MAKPKFGRYDRRSPLLAATDGLILYLRRVTEMFQSVLVIAALGALLATIAKFYQADPSIFRLPSTSRPGEARAARNIAEDALAQVRADRQQLLALQNDIKKLGTPVGPQLFSAQLAQINRTEQDLTRRMSAIEVAIMNSPEKALSLPLMKRDLDAQKLANDASTAAIKANVDQLYDLMKYLLGSATLGILSLAAATFFRSWAPRPTKEAPAATPAPPTPALVP